MAGWPHFCPVFTTMCACLTRLSSPPLARVNPGCSVSTTPPLNSPHLSRLEAHDYHTKYLATFSEKAPATADAEAVAVKVVTAAIGDSQLHQMDGLLQLHAVQQLGKSKDAGAKALFALLGVFVTGAHADFVAWSKSNKSVLAKFGLDEDKCVDKIRMLTLCGLADGMPASYADVAKLLAVETDEVERIVVGACVKKVVRAKLDQEKQQIITSWVMQRSFEQKQWVNLRDTLTEWKAQTDNFLDEVKQMRANALETGAA